MTAACDPLVEGCTRKNVNELNRNFYYIEFDKICSRYKFIPYLNNSPQAVCLPSALNSLYRDGLQQTLNCSTHVLYWVISLHLLYMDQRPPDPSHM